MDTKDIIKATQSAQRLVQDENYYRNIFKKTERIVSVVFYVTHNIGDNEKYTTHIKDIESAARAVHDEILRSLEVRAHVAEDTVQACAHAVIALDSKLRVAQVSGLFSPEILGVLHNEIDGVLRGMNRYLVEDTTVFGEAATPAPAARRSVDPAPAGEQKKGVPVLSSGGSKDNRRDRILTVLEARGEATIKDIAEIINDVSEKTIQRELNAMINDNIVKRQGERRWSKYSKF